MDELLAMYFYDKEDKGEKTVDGFWAWQRSQEKVKKLSSNYVYASEMILNELMAVLAFRVSVRKNNYQGKCYVYQHRNSWYNPHKS